MARYDDRDLRDRPAGGGEGQLAQAAGFGDAAAVSELQGRREGQAQLRDAFALRQPGDDPGPAGRMRG
ncbi:hypothetical protein DPM13_01015 [Paracoccus mutanolyticus]|uniref:Uncharacterized protein n=1 Tax=Paracoccus mutanolyticus TaxID=1499308 RepID=A0ABM6WUK5_9RHOB|nr:hypothetical protein DPM13_01015 [Paracoccus mutanolyticus]